MTMPRMTTMLLLTAGLPMGAACNDSNGPMTLPAVAARSGRIAFTSDRDGTKQIYLMNADGSNPTRLTRGPASNSNAAWSPDGTKITFISYGRGSIVGTDSVGEHALTKATKNNESSVWSPDGMQIALSGT